MPEPTGAVPPPMTEQAHASDSAGAMARLYTLLAAVLGSHPDWESMAALARVARLLHLACPDDLSPSEADREYTELFVVPGPRYVAPYESVFRDRWILPANRKPGSTPGECGMVIKGLLMGESTAQVRRIFVEAGLLPEHDLPDHIANELRLAAHLSALEAGGRPEEAAQAIRLRVRLLDEHLAKWIGDLRRRVAEHDRLGYYRAALETTEMVLASDLVEQREPGGEFAGPVA